MQCAWSLAMYGVQVPRGPDVRHERRAKGAKRPSEHPPDGGLGDTRESGRRLFMLYAKRVDHERYGVIKAREHDKLDELLWRET